jgi:hypothetical protein
MQKTMVLVIEYPDFMQERLEKMLKPVTTDVNMHYGEIWQPYNVLACTELSEVLESIKDALNEKQTAKRIAREKADKIARKIRDRIIERDHELLKAMNTGSKEIKKNGKTNRSTETD